MSTEGAGPGTGPGPGPGPGPGDRAEPADRPAPGRASASDRAEPADRAGFERAGAADRPESGRPKDRGDSESAGATSGAVSADGPGRVSGAGQADVPVEPAGDVRNDGAAAAAAEPPGPDLARAALDAARQVARGRRTGGKRLASGNRRRGLTGSGPDPGDPQPFGALIDRLIRDRGWERTAAEASVMGRWESLVGVDVAAHCQPESLREGELVLVAESTAWATQLRLLAAGILATLTRELGADVVSRIRVHGPATPSWRRGPRHVSGRGPRDTYG